MAKVKVKILNATIDGKGPGEIISIDEKSADHYEKIYYVERVGAAAKKDSGNDDGGDSDSK